jgi:rSAM/selenodomain-associated transferase 1
MIFPGFRLLVLTRAPRAGHVKTRLIAQLGAQGAADFHARLIHRCLETTTGAGLCPVELWCAPASHEAFFEACRDRYAVQLYDQHPGNLGERMHDALASALRRGEAAVLIGTDIPLLEAADLHTALQALQHGRDAVVGPAADGGYYLIGLRHAARQVFDQIPWGTAAVFRETSARLRQLGMNWLRLREHADVDTPDDLRRLPESIKRILATNNRATGVQLRIGQDHRKK